MSFTLKTFNFTSDIHVDFYKSKINPKKLPEYFMEGIPKTETLIVAGDLANNNEDSIKLLKILLESWKTVILVDGNHDWYGDIKKTIENGRWARLKRHFQNEERLIFLGSEKGILESSDGFKIAGSNMWYDIESPDVLVSAMTYMNDGRMIGIGKMEDLARKELSFYNDVIDKVDLFVSHVPLIDQFCGLPGFGDKCYYRRVRLSEKKVYLSGHMHEGYSMAFESGIFLSKPIGYDFKGRTFGHFDMTTRKFL